MIVFAILSSLEWLITQLQQLDISLEDLSILPEVASFFSRWKMGVITIDQLLVLLIALNAQREQGSGRYND